MRTRRLNAPTSAALQADHVAAHEIAAFLLDCYQRLLTRQTPRGEDDSPICQVPDRVAAKCGIRQFDGDRRLG